jgi:mannose-6-phosphate isomerase
MKTPLTFKPVYKDYIWGGDRLSTHFHRSNTPTPCAESWEISVHPDGPSIVAHGPYAGRSLPDLAVEFGVALMGTKTPDPKRFPLLFKLIDARDTLSVQVHPNNANAALTCGEPKTEMWYVLDCPPGARLYAGLQEGTTPETLRAALDNGTADACLKEVPIHPGDAIFIPGGLVHAIGEGCLIYEVQQNSNTTYRLYDWNRTGADNTPRPLHIEESFKTIDWTNGEENARMRKYENARMTGYQPLICCDFFQVGKLALTGCTTVEQDGTTFSALFVEDGALSVEAGGEAVRLCKGMSCLIPAAAPTFTLNGDTSLVITTL